MVDVAHPLWVISWRSVELQVGRVVHHRHSRGQHAISTMEPPWGSESTTQAVRTALPSPRTLPHRRAHLLLHGHVRNPFPDPRKLGGR